MTLSPQQVESALVMGFIRNLRNGSKSKMDEYGANAGSTDEPGEVDTQGWPDVAEPGDVAQSVTGTPVVDIAPEHEYPDGTPVEDVTPAGEGAADEPSVPRRVKGGLSAEVKTVTDEYVAGTWKPTDAEGGALALTPHRIATRLKDRDGLASAPSTGAITNVIQAWADLGFANTTKPPLTFVSYAGSGGGVELAGLVEAQKANKKAERAAKKASEAAESAPATEEPAVV